MKRFKLILQFFLLIFFSMPPFVTAQQLDLTTGNAEVHGDASVSLQHLSVDGRFYDAVIHLNLDGTYQIVSAQEVILDAEASYQVTFESFWSEATHPYEFPGLSAHYSGLIGATHKSDFILWKTGQVASPGIESMAETGSKTPLNSEISVAIAAGEAEFLLSGGGISRSPGNVTLNFDVSREFPFVSLVSMIAPSPDWFVGVSGLSLIRNGQWLDQLEVLLFAYDAGTDSGSEYTSPNSDTQPQTPISQLQDVPFRVDGQIPPMGRLIFKRL